MAPDIDEDAPLTPERAPIRDDASPGTTMSSPSTRPREVSQMYRNLLAGAYTTLVNGLAASSFTLMTGFARLCGGHLPSAQDSHQIFAECRELIAGEIRSDITNDIRSSPYYAVSVDEKDRMLVCLLTYFKAGKKECVALGYKDLPGFEASDLFSQIKALLDASGLSNEHLVAFTADGASVNGTRKALGDVRGDNVGKRLQEWAGHPILIIHCDPHKLQPLVKTK